MSTATFAIVNRRTRIAATDSADLGATRAAARSMGILMDLTISAVEGRVARGQKVRRVIDLNDHVRTVLCLKHNATIRCSYIAPHTDTFDAWINEVHHTLRVDDVI